MNKRSDPTRQLLTGVLTACCIMVAGNALSATYVGEDGIAYPDAAPRLATGIDKIYPELFDAARSQDNLDVVIYIARYSPRAGDADPARSAKATHMAEIDRVGEEIRTLMNRYRPLYSMDEEEEKAWLRGVAGRPLPGADHDRLYDLKRQLDDTRTAMNKAVAAAVEAAGAAERKEMIDEIFAAGGKVTAEIALTNAIGATIPATMLDTLAYDKRVLEVLPNPAVDYELDISSPAVGWPTWHNAGVDGSGIFDVGVIDTGVQENHPALTPAEGFHTNSATHTDPDQEVGHGTHVAGIMASSNGTIEGGVPNVGAIVWEHAGNQATTMSRMHNMASDFVQSPEAVNHSLGYGTANDVDYNANDSFYDAFVDNFEIMVSKSAGNGGWTTTNPGNPAITITHPAPAYNHLVVANMNDRNTTTRTDDVRSGSSSVGPTVGGRRKPDIAAPGSNITSTNFYWPGAGVLPYNACNGPARAGADNIDDFCILSGTSMAAPHVGASVVLMEDGGNVIPRTQKAVLLNTADAWDSNDTSTTGDDGQQATPACGAGFDPCDTLWDKSYGWGYLDMTETEFNNLDFFTDSIVPNNNTAVEDDYELYKGNMFVNEKATMTWYKRADTYNDGAPAGGQRAIGDLNIRLYANSDGDLIDGDFTGTDNVQQVVATEFGEKVIKVYSWSNSFDGASSLTFTLATEENFVRVNPPTFTATPLIPIVGPFQTFTSPTQVTNTGTIGAHDTTVSIGNIAGVSGDGTGQSIGTIANGAVEQVDFTLTTTGLTAGTYFVPVTVSSNSYDETYTGNFPSGVEFIVETTPPTSDCNDLADATNQSAIGIDWNATDGFFGTGVDFARLYVVTPGAPSFVYTGLQQDGFSGTFNYNMSAGDGTYRFAIRARDNGGNWESVPVSAECVTFLDTVDPASTVSTPLFDVGGTIPLTFSVTDAAPSSGLEFVDFWYYKEPNGPWTYTGLFSNVNNGVVNWLPPGAGVYHFVSRAKDNAQNIENGTFAPPPADSVTNYGAIDTDGDSVLDLNDNCRLVANADQRDTNGDNIGNLCDPDINNDCIVNFTDLQLYKANFFAAGDLDTDNNGDGFTNFADLQIAKSFFFGPPGPGALGACN